MQLEFMLPEVFQYCSLFIFICLYLFVYSPALYKTRKSTILIKPIQVRLHQA